MVSLVLFVIAEVIFGDGPDVGDKADVILGFFKDNREQTLWALFVHGFGVLAMIWFMAALVMAMRDAREQLLALTTGLSFVVALSLGSFSTMMRMGLPVIVVGDLDAEIVAAIFRLGYLMDTSQNIISAGFFIPVGVVTLRTGFIAAWWGWVSVAAGFWAVISTTAWNPDGFWSPGGAGYVNLVSYSIWLGGTSLLLLTRKREVNG